MFGIKQANASIFGGALLFFLIFTHYIELPFFYRYDYILFFALLFQAFLIIFKLESKKEIFIVFAFHLIAMAMELFKTSEAIGSWKYPGEAFFIIATVPLFTGFLYSAVGSYIVRAWKLFKLRFTHYPNLIATTVVGIAIYANFFTHHYFYDIRYIIFGLLALLFWKTKVFFTVEEKERSMPLLLGFFLVAFFIWIAENTGTFTKVWLYPSQEFAWSLVSFNKIGSWFLLMIVSFILISLVQRKTLREKRD